MTTAGKPTFDPARGGSGKNEKTYNILSKQFSSRDLPAHLKLKVRVQGQESKEEIKLKDFKRELLERETEARLKKMAEENNDSGPSLAITYSDKKESNENSEESESDDEEETAALLAELQRIREERAEAKAKKDLRDREEAEKVKINQTITGNPLLNQEQSNFLVKRKWNDDVIFKNCAKDNSKVQKQGFINDMLRSDFHRRFMDKYIK